MAPDSFHWSRSTGKAAGASKLRLHAIEALA